MIFSLILPNLSLFCIGACIGLLTSLPTIMWSRSNPGSVPSLGRAGFSSPTTPCAFVIQRSWSIFLSFPNRSILYPITNLTVFPYLNPRAGASFWFHQSIGSIFFCWWCTVIIFAVCCTLCPGSFLSEIEPSHFATFSFLTSGHRPFFPLWLTNTKLEVNSPAFISDSPYCVVTISKVRPYLDFHVSFSFRVGAKHRQFLDFLWRFGSFCVYSLSRGFPTQPFFIFIFLLFCTVVSQCPSI